MKIEECLMDGEIDFMEGDIYKMIKVVFENKGKKEEKEKWMKEEGKMSVILRRLKKMKKI